LDRPIGHCGVARWRWVMSFRTGARLTATVAAPWDLSLKSAASACVRRSTRRC
jgi:hypothetical protein